jgi:flavin-dependent dehydrogenase
MQAEIPERCDVVVIGGGPAGSSAAALLAQKGLDVVLFDKAKHPRPNVGESLIPHFWKFADLTGVSPKVEKEGFIAKAGGITVWNGRIHQFSFSSFGYTRPALHVERDRFDHILLEHAADSGAQVFEEVSVNGADFSSENPVVSYYDMLPDKRGSGQISCRYVVDASGVATVLAKQFNARKIINYKHKFLGMWGYFDNANYVGADGCSHRPDELPGVKPVTFVLSYEEGWVWHIALRDRTSVGLVINTDRIKRMGKEEQEAYYLDTVHRIPYLRELLQPATYREGSLTFRPDYSYYSTKTTGENFCCIGDAGAFVDPIFSHGVQAAFYNAAVAAWTIESSFKRPHNAAKYARILETRLQQHYGFSRSLALGDFGGEGVRSDLVQALMKSMPPIELEMMLVASDISNRSTNFLKMARDAGVVGNFENGYVSERARILETLHV